MNAWAESEPEDLSSESPKPILKQPQKPTSLSQHVVEYHIDVKLNAEQKQLYGQQTLTWTNPGSVPVSELYFHMYPNAFQSKKTSFIQESGGQLRNDKMREDSFGHMNILTMTTTKGEDLTTRMEFVQPDDGNKHDQTLLKVPLSEAIYPGHEYTVQIDFEVVLPFTFARMGYVDDFVMAGQWFPKIAAYEAKGTRDREQDGWNLHQYHGNSEFYANFGSYNVKIQVPADYIVAATGFPTEKPVPQGDRKTYHFYIDDVHDFAWAASPHFEYVEVPFSTENIPGVRIKLYLDPKHAHLEERYLYAAKQSLMRYSEWYGSYPYSTLSIVVPPEGGNGAGGMEYPTLITAWAAEEETPGLDLERVIIHEIGHQYWYGMVASNEFEEAWLDEGLTSYAEDRVMESEYGIISNTLIESSYITSPQSLQRPSWEYRDQNEYAENVYTRAKLVLKTIEQEIGVKQMDQVLRTYFQQWKFKHPSTTDFQNTLEQVTGQSWDKFFEQFVYGGLMLDYAVESIQVQPLRKDGKLLYESTVVIHRNGGFYQPVPIKFHFADNSSYMNNWEGMDNRTQFTLVHSTPVDWVMIDPEYTLILENKHINNFMKTTVNERTQVRWNVGVTKIIETIVGWVAW